MAALVVYLSARVAKVATVIGTKTVDSGGKAWLVGFIESYGLPSADAARAASLRAVFAVMAVFARSAGIASCAGRCFRYAPES